MTLLTVVQDAAGRVGIPKPTSVYTSSDPQAILLLSLANQEGKELARRHKWQRIVTEATFTTVASTSAYDLPTDFDRMIEGSIYNRTQARPVIGPIDTQRWQQLKALRVNATWGAIYLRGNQINFTPTPTATDTIAYEYVSKYWCTTTGGTTATLAAWSGDTDIGILDEECMTLGLVWRFLRARGLDYGEAFRAYEEQVVQRMAHDGGQRILDMSSEPGNGVYDPYISDGSWALT